MTDQSTSGNRWEPETPPSAPAATPAPGATAVQDPPAPPVGAWAPPPVPQRHGLKDRWQGAPRGARLGAAGALALLLLLAVGLGGFALGRGTAPDGGGQPDGLTPGGRPGDRPDVDFGGDGGPGRGDFAPPDQGLDDGTGTDDGTNSGTGTGTLSWYVVPNPAAGSAGSTAA
ncbi:hypothetical protein [Nocardioides sp.]|uniref:hypothetical protein n=1 Tax=Nocardioides sp. TaxID=35761 RepID=UPI00271FEA3B|nr:hypothetical protein [Nocardioides sp.]MDO9454531.1 hypothetical protein [Nocardioides sp.]